MFCVVFVFSDNGSGNHSFVRNIFVRYLSEVLVDFFNSDIKDADVNILLRRYFAACYNFQSNWMSESHKSVRKTDFFVCLITQYTKRDSCSNEQLYQCLFLY